MRDLRRSQFDIFLTLFTTVAVVALDRVTKMFFCGLLSYGESIPVIHNVLHMTMVHNTGIAFGLFKDKGLVFIIIPIVAIILLFILIKRPKLFFLLLFLFIAGIGVVELFEKLSGMMEAHQKSPFSRH